MMIKRLPFLLLVLLLFAPPLTANAQEPTPTPFPTIVPRVYYTNTLDWVVDTDEFRLIPITDTHGAGTLDFGFWNFESFQTLVRISNTVKHLGNTYHFWDILFVFAIGGLIIGPLVRIIKSRGNAG